MWWFPSEQEQNRKSNSRINGMCCAKRKFYQRAWLLLPRYINRAGLSLQQVGRFTFTHVGWTRGLVARYKRSSTQRKHSPSISPPVVNIGGAFASGASPFGDFLLMVDCQRTATRTPRTTSNCPSGARKCVWDYVFFAKLKFKIYFQELLRNAKII